MLTAPSFNEFCLVTDSQSGVRPGATSYGTTVTPGNNTYGSYASLIAGASVTDDAYGILINVNNIGANTFATDTLVTLGLDAAGGSSFTDFITDLIVSGACAYGGAQAVYYYFPVLIKAGTSIGMKATQNNASPRNASAFVRLFCQPSRPDLIKVGSRVVTYGSTPATSTGTAVTAGTTSDGTYVQLGTIAAGGRPFFWQAGVGFNNGAIASEEYHYDLAIGQSGAKRTPILDAYWFISSAETSYNVPVFQGFALGAPGELVYGRLQGAAGAQSGLSMVAYGVC